ncbi:3'-5' exonuclease [Kitasatospora aureofaciens]|uniref:exonuclease domain-containing protein n=1 Tax=Kitasatospora aureofaciens TaxID=1894 RepID=UPI001C454DD5|nr:exonuclease domain-containing protein [Kitasatospora aureofaciens]MBV6697488.1 3'-5' exonuclease [Kitasatospora aureofaciens]
MSWWTREWLAVDLETTGLDPQTDRIVTAAAVWCVRGVPFETRTWLADAGKQTIPAEATKIHGVTTRHAHQYGQPAGLVAHTVAELLPLAADDGLPIVVANAPYDLTMLSCELARASYRWRQIRTRMPLLVLDPLLLDWKLDPFRDGRRRLEDLCRYYEVEHDGPHRADADAAAAAAVAYQIVSRFPQLQAMTLAEVHEAQVGWAVERAAARQAYKRRNGDPTAVVDGHWPLIPRQEVTS